VVVVVRKESEIPDASVRGHLHVASFAAPSAAQPTADTADTTLTLPKSTAAQPVYAYMHSECPVNRRELGR
jgi:hypothetical protein